MAESPDTPQPTDMSDVEVANVEDQSPALAADGSIQPAANNVAQAPPEAVMARQQQRQDDENREKESSGASLSMLKLTRLYALPLVVVIVFIGIVFTLIIPSISTIFTNLGEADRLDEQIINLNDRLTDLELLSQNINRIQGDLAAINVIIPERVTEVVNFQQRITRVARQNFNLKVTQAETGETLLSSAVESPDNPAAEALSIIEIPSVFSMTGSLQNIQGFISAIQQTDDFIIIGEMELTSNSNTDGTPISALESGEWRLDITLVKYQFPVANENNNLEDIYAQVPPNVEINQEVLRYVKNKVALGQRDDL